MCSVCGSVYIFCLLTGVGSHAHQNGGGGGAVKWTPHCGVSHFLIRTCPTVAIPRV